MTRVEHFFDYLWRTNFKDAAALCLSVKLIMCLSLSDYLMCVFFFFFVNGRCLGVYVCVCFSPSSLSAAVQAEFRHPRLSTTGIKDRETL